MQQTSNRIPIPTIMESIGLILLSITMVPRPTTITPSIRTMLTAALIDRAPINQLIISLDSLASTTIT